MDIELACGGLLRLDGDVRGVGISCLRGVLWLTQSGDDRDLVLRPGGALRVRRRGRIVIFAGDASALRLQGGDRRVRLEGVGALLSEKLANFLRMD